MSAPTAGMTSIFPMPSQRGKRSSALMAAVPTIPPIKGANAESTVHPSSRSAFRQGGKSCEPAEASAFGLSLPPDVLRRRACPSQVRKDCYSLGRVTKNDMMAPKPQSDPIIATVGQRSARLLGVDPTVVSPAAIWITEAALLTCFPNVPDVPSYAPKKIP